MTYQQQAEEEMWEAAARNDTEPQPLAYSVYVGDTGARCLSTDSFAEATERADKVQGYVLNRFEQRIYPPPGSPGFDPRIDYPERYTDGPI